MANTKKTRQITAEFETELNQWLLGQFDIALYMASGLAECSGADLKNEPAGSYSDIFKRVSGSISEKKSARYTAKQIQRLNCRKAQDYTRECKICKRLGHLTEEGICESCDAILRISRDILYSEFFVILKQPQEKALPLPFGAYLIAEQENGLKERIFYVPTYSGNKIF